MKHNGFEYVDLGLPVELSGQDVMYALIRRLIADYTFLGVRQKAMIASSILNNSA